MNIQLIGILLLLISLGIYLIFHREQSTDSDTSTQSNIDQVITLHYKLDLRVDFDQKKLIGSNTLTLRSLVKQLKVVRLDVSHLRILRVIDEENQVLNYRISEKQKETMELGEYIEIYLPHYRKQNANFNITVYYETQPDSTVFSWLEPQQTSGGKYPYLYSQCEPIYCRQIAPLQDSPQIKSTYSAIIQTPKPLKAYLSANLIQQTEDDIYIYSHFILNIPIPSYLLAIVVGNLQERQLGPRTAVITEPEQIELSSKELEDLEQMLISVENYVQYPYVWGVYKIVILPPSFPYGGMENPLITFASPSIIVGDKSQISVAIHEIAHSWTGNLVTNSNWKHFWVNEGFTRFLERKGAEQFLGKDYIPLDEAAGYKQLLQDIETQGKDSSYSSLQPIIKYQNPDSYFSIIPYEKGYHLLKYIESLIGKNNFQELFVKWIQSNAYQSVNSIDFIKHVKNVMKQQFGKQKYHSIYKQIDWKTWLHTPGEPPISIHIESPLINEAKQLAEDYILLQGKASPENYQKFNTFYSRAKVITLDYLLNNQQRLTLDILKRFENDYSQYLTNLRQCDLMTRYLRLCILLKHSEKFPLLSLYMGSIGRQLYISPLYTELKKVALTELGWNIFNQYEGFYHPIARKAFKNILSS